MLRNLKVSVVSPFREEGDTYPQVAHLAKWLRQHATVNWVTIAERGFRLDRLLDNTFLGLRNRFPLTNSSCLPKGSVRGTCRAAMQTAADWWAVRHATAQCDLVLVIDFMALALAAAASSKPIVLWSHDFISEDEERHRRKANRL